MIQNENPSKDISHYKPIQIALCCPNCPTPLYPNNDSKILPLTIPKKCQAKKTT
jgi:hypothetical protein